MAFCLGNLVELLNQILHPDQYRLTWVLDDHKKPQIQSLFRKVSFLRDFLANSTPSIQARIEHLEDLIRDETEKAEDLLESYINALVLSSPSGESILVSPPEVDDVIQVLESTTAEMIKITDEIERSEKTPPAAVPTRSVDSVTANDVLVGVQTSLAQLRARITSKSKAREVIPIVGMGGIGKTTLARKLYDEYSASKHFDICLWATISQVYDQRQVLLSLLNCTASEKANHELKVDLHKMLYNRRYLIVIDDVWSSNVWDDIQTSFPNDNIRSRIILTTRGNDVADYVSSKRHQMALLKEGESWELFQKIVYGVESCPTDLEEVSHKIVNSCGGLPLAVKVISGFLSRAKRSRDLWEKVAHDVSSFIGQEDEQFSGIFSWSYANLPHYLKPCLLYIGAYPEDYVIPASRLIKLWVAEGFLNPTEGKSPEEVAEMCLKALVDRNIIFVRETTFNKRPASYGIHDLLRDLCLRKAKEKKFIKLEDFNNLSNDELCFRRICASSLESNADFTGSLKLMPQVRSFHVVGAMTKYTFADHGFELSLLRVLVYPHKFMRFAECIDKLIGLRYLEVHSDSSELPDSIIVLRNLQTMIITFLGSQTNYYFQMRIFELPQLRHVNLFLYKGWDIPAIIPRFGIVETLQSLSTVTVTLVKSLLGKIPNLKELGIQRAMKETAAGDEIDLTCFQKLEILTLDNTGETNFIFPDSLEELIINNSNSLSQTCMIRIGALPNLQLLQLEFCVLESETWEPSEGEFCNLQYLALWFCYNLEKWIADETHFPQLKHLYIHDCPGLKEIPLEIGGIETLEIIDVRGCKNSVFNSARSIIEEQNYLGNDLLQIRLGKHQFSDPNDEDEGSCVVQ